MRARTPALAASGAARSLPSRPPARCPAGAGGPDPCGGSRSGSGGEVAPFPWRGPPPSFAGDPRPPGGAAPLPLREGTLWAPGGLGRLRRSSAPCEGWGAGIRDSPPPPARCRLSPRGPAAEASVALRGAEGPRHRPLRAGGAELSRRAMRGDPPRVLYLSLVFLPLL